MKRLCLLIMLIAWCTNIHAQERTAAFEMVERLGRGINMGNAFEAPSETAWSNPWKPEYFRIMSELGFSHVRVPIRWEPDARSMAGQPYSIYPAFLDRIKQVVDTALKYKLHIIINMHHHDALFNAPAAQKARFLSQWYQIADFFKSYPDSLLFEVLNEPNGNLTAELWNQYFPDALAEIRKTNPDRMVLIGTAEWGGLGGLAKLQVPADENLILTVHYYNPFQFTHQGAEWSGSEAQSWLGTKWLDSEAEREVVKNDFKAAVQFSQTHKIPVHVGEFGAYSKADLASRVRWTTFLSRWFEEQGFSWAYWEFSAGFGIYNPATKQMLTPLADALLKNEIPEPAKVEATTLYSSNFNSGNDGWNLQVNTSGGASANLTRSGGKLNVNVNNGGTQGWHVQLIRYNVAVQAGKTYRVSFRASGPAARSVTVNIGRNSDPWTTYSGYVTVNLNQTEDLFSFVFTSTVTDPAARMAFDLGNVASGMTIHDIRIESVVIIPTSVQSLNTPIFNYYPNPFDNLINVDNPGVWERAEIFNISGIKMGEYSLFHGINRLETRHLSRGAYLLRLTGNSLSESVRIFRM